MQVLYVVGLMLRPFWHFMLKSCKDVLDISWHGKVAFTFDVIPIKSDSQILTSFPIYVAVVMFFEYADEMVCMLLSHICYSKIIDDQRK